MASFPLSAFCNVYWRFLEYTLGTNNTGITQLVKVIESFCPEQIFLRIFFYLFYADTNASEIMVKTFYNQIIVFYGVYNNTFK